MKILVTGGAGFIGSHVVDAYIREGHQVYVIDNLSTGDKTYLHKKACFIEMDIRDNKNIQDLFMVEKFDLVNHHAAQMDVRLAVEEPVFDAEVNILGSLNLLQASIASGVKKFIFISSGGAVYGEIDDKELPAEEIHAINPISPYGVSKHVVEHYLYLYHQVYSLNYTVLRYGNVYGERQGKTGEAGVLSIFIRQMLNHKPVRIFGSGEQLRDYIYVGDVVRANLFVSNFNPFDKPISHFVDPIFNIGTGKGSSVNEIYLILKNLLQSDLPPIYEPARKGEILKTYIDCGKAAKYFNWNSEVSLTEGIEKTLQWFKTNLS
ncbi:MAG: NAD-dependent epimerase/dehydratase family protein [Candidatus Aureabacteria bacterium]|nr:NAD-dependent epimerase/dehydratase family protein [Candidatus Auribacterota bacterium]